MDLKKFGVLFMLVMALSVRISVSGQNNVVLNPSFEDTVQCVTAAGQVGGYVANWDNLCPTTSSDYYHTDCPFNASAWQTPRTGKGMAGLMPYFRFTPEREYIIGEFCDSLLPGETYSVEFYVNKHEDYFRIIHQMGCYITADPTPFATCPEAPNFTPAVVYGAFLDDHIGWTRINGTYTAAGGERYIILGNFGDDANTTQGGGSTGTIDQSYYFIEDISVVPTRFEDPVTDIIVCDSNPVWVTIADPLATNVSWSDGTIGDSVLVSGTDTLQVLFDVGNCTFTDEVIVTYNPIPALPLLSVHDTTGCTGDIIQVDVTRPGASAYFWSPPGTFSGISCGVSSPIDSVQCFTTDGTYVVEVVYGNCSYFDSVTVQFDPQPPIDLGPDLLICPGDTALIDGTTPGISGLLWSTGDTVSAMITVTDSGWYWLEVRTPGGCVRRDSVYLNVGAFPSVNLGGDTLLCGNDSITLEAGAGYFSYLWIDGSTADTLVVDTTGTFWVTVSDSAGCSTSDTLLISTGVGPQFSFGEDRSECTAQYMLNPGITDPTVTYEWSTGANTDSLSISETGSYWLTAYNECGSTTDTIFLILIDDSLRYFLPNVFTPNADGINDFFTTETGIPLEPFELHIVDRWGKLVYETTDPFFSWNGNAQSGSPVPAGVYFVTLYGINCAEYPFTASGTLTVIR